MLAFLAVARERSFTRAAAQLGVSQSALSQTLRGLEARLGLRLLTRTTRSVAPTEAGERLLLAVGPALDEIDAGLAALSELREKPAGTIRITTHEHAASVILLPALAKLLPDYPDINVELVIDYGLTDIVAGRYDAGVRSGEMVAKDMIAVRIGPDMRMAVVGAPSCFADAGGAANAAGPDDAPLHQPSPADARWPLRLGVWKGWPRAAGSGRGATRVQYTALALQAALAGLGLAYLPEEQVEAHLEAGRLVRVLTDWCEPFPGYHLYYPSRRQPTPAFTVLVDALRYRDNRRAVRQP